MAKDYPVGSAQGKVLNALGLTATGFSDAERIFGEIGIEVTSKRLGRTTEPVIAQKSATRGGWNSGGDGESYETNYKDADLSKIAQWMKE